jgi:stage V sporulation protein R
MISKQRVNELADLARKNGLDFFPVVFEEVTVETMNNVGAYGLPTRARHWRYGRSYDHQKTYGQMGYSKVYEMITNNDPSYAFVADTNSEAQNLLITAHCFGHCLVPGTLVETPHGPKVIEELAPGDFVLTHTGKIGTVLATSRRHVSGKAVSIKIGSNAWTTATEEHPFLVLRKRLCRRGFIKTCRPTCATAKRHKEPYPYEQYAPEWVPAGALRVGDLAVFPRHRASGSLDSVTICDSKGEKHPGGVVTVRYDMRLDGDFGEFLGLYAAEGYARKGGQMGLCFGIHENSLHDRSRALVRNLFSLDTYHDLDEEHHSFQVLFDEKVLADWLRTNMGHSCDTKQLPESIFTGAGEDFYKGFLRGVFRGDGTDRAPRQLSLSTTSATLASQVRHMCHALGVMCRINQQKRDDRKPSFDVVVSGSSHIRLAAIASMEKDVDNRSFEHGWMDEEHVYLPITKIELQQATDLEVINLQVPGDSSFVLFGGVATHNSDFFKNNVAFKGSDRNMVRHAGEHAGRIDRYIHEHGLDAVERLMDAAFALEYHIDVHRGLYRKPYGKRTTRTRPRKKDEFDDLLIRERRPSIIREVINTRLPPRPERDLLWFFINYAPLEDWERDVLDIVREEAFYFHPQIATKIMNEGWAVYWHAELLFQYEGITPEEHIDFASTHEKVVQAGPFYSINPYFLGFRLFKDIEKRWDELHEKGESPITGRQKIFQVRAEEDDISFLRNYVTDEFVEELGLFTFGQTDKDDSRIRGMKDKFYEIKNRVRDEVVEALVRPRYNCGVPDVAIVDASSEKIRLKHNSEHIGTLDFRYAEKTLEYIWELWTAPVELSCLNDDGNEVTLCFDEAGFYTTSPVEELEELEFETDED